MKKAQLFNSQPQKMKFFLKIPINKASNFQRLKKIVIQILSLKSMKTYQKMGQATLS